MSESHNHLMLADRDLAPADVARMVQALLVSIDRGEVRASPREVAFLSSIAEMLAFPDDPIPT